MNGSGTYVLDVMFSKYAILVGSELVRDLIVASPSQGAPSKGSLFGTFLKWMMLVLNLKWSDDYTQLKSWTNLKWITK